jgi:hypothetical protein
MPGLLYLRCFACEPHLKICDYMYRERSLLSQWAFALTRLCLETSPLLEACEDMDFGHILRI